MLSENDFEIRIMVSVKFSLSLNEVIFLYAIIGRVNYAFFTMKLFEVYSSKIMLKKKKKIGNTRNRGIDSGIK